ncbi:MAG TPA: GDSL-type esterase/lipase family protein [Nitrospira sp.]|nr:GDSL-type esterase/lipase family protein [Nitrospira sp.]
MRWSLILLLGSVLAGDHLRDIDADSAIPTWSNNGDSSWWYARHREIQDRVHDSDPLAVMMGDSITQGWEDAGQVVWQQYYGKRRAMNLGFNKDRTEDLLWRLQHGEIAGMSPKLAIVMIGTNNLAAGQSEQRTAAGIHAVVLALRERLPHTNILLLAIFPRLASPRDPLRRSIRSVNEIIARYADDRHIFYLDLTEKFVDDKGDLLQDVMPDGIHPNELGYRIWAEAMEPTIEQLLHTQETTD